MENKEKALKVIKAMRMHYFWGGCFTNCPYFNTDRCVDKLLHDIFELVERIYKV